MNKFLRLLFISFFSAISFSSIAQNKFWTASTDAEATNTNLKRVTIPKHYLTFKLDTTALLDALRQAPEEFSTAARLNPLVISLPMPNGEQKHFSITSYSMMEPALANEFPDIRTYSGQGIEDPTATLKMDWTSFGLHVMILSPTSESVWIDPFARGEKEYYISYYKKDLSPKYFQETDVLPAEEGKGGLDGIVAGGPCLGPTLRSYRLAVACTGEYAVAVGGTTPALLRSAIVTTVNRVNGVYEQEVTVRLVLIANNSVIEYLTPAGDPFTGNDNPNVLINESQSVINANIGAANYDVGHTFSTGGGGLAQLGCVCTTNKARGITGLPNPVGDGYDIDFVAHEVGHQFGGQHTFNAASGSCSGNGSTTANAEPGSGSTIMGYAGICTSTNDLQGNSDPQFHAISFDQIGTFSRTGSGSICGTAIATGNTAPTVAAGADFTIPISTPFMLTGSATDVNGDALTYSWEQVNVGGPFTTWNLPSGNAPIFRSFAPVATGVRIFPKITDIINNVTTIGEILPSYVRTMAFRLTARDNRAGAAGICYDEIAVTTAGSTAFNVTSQPSAVTWTANGSNTAIITWTVAGTTAAPFNVSNVDILLSVDGGFTYPYTLVSNTANDGTETIIIPSANTTKGRVMVKSRGNIFFDINLGNITIASTCGAEGAVVAPANTVTAVAGNAALNLGLSPQFSAPLTIAGTLATTDPASSLAVNNTAGNVCVNFSNQMKYDSYVFTASTSATYTFTLTGVFPTIMNLYNGSFSGSASCTNFLASNTNFTAPSSVAVGTTITRALTAGNTYVLVIGTFSITQPTLPAAYSVAVSSAPAGGNIFGGSGIYLNPGGSFNYAYVIVNNATGIIRGISATANLTNAATYPAGTYSVYGLSYSNAILNLNSFVNGAFQNLLNSIFGNPTGFCANLSKNIVTVNITSSPVPVSFLGLTARKSGSKVQLYWKTTSEQNSAFFSIQRSANGADFSGSLGRVDAAGTSNTTRDYAFLDQQPVKGWNYYRIEQVDQDNTRNYSNTAAVNFDGTGNLIILYPNPASDQLNVAVTSAVNSKMLLQFFDSKGSKVMQQTINVQTGRTVSNINISALPSGVYLIRYTEPDGQFSSVRFIKQ
ncbi:MAG: M12 family metallo-peptidase [Sphingobacteriales bacterium]|nr:M12 family metallo-peptidase [Sphingobacteriales bacterium]